MTTPEQPSTQGGVDISIDIEAMGRRWMLLRAAKNWPAMAALNDEAQRKELGVTQDRLLEVPLSELPLGTSVLNRLEELGVLLIGDLAELTCLDLLQKKGVSHHTVDAIWWSVLKYSSERDQIREDLEEEIKRSKSGLQRSTQ